MEKIYVIASDSNLKLNEKLNSLINGFNGVDYDLINFDGDESSLAILLEEINTIPFLNEHKIVVLKNPKYLINPDKYQDKLIDSLKTYIKKPIDTTTLIILIDDIKSFDKSFKEIIEKNVIIYQEKSLKEEDASEYIKNSLKNDGFKFDHHVVDEILYRTKGNLERVIVELEKIKIYKYESKNINLRDVMTIVSKDLDDNIFDLVNAVVENNKKRSIEIHNDLMVLNEDSGKIISLLISKFTELYQTKVLKNKGYSKNDIAQVFNCKPGKVYYLEKSVANITIQKLKKNINTLLDLDYKIKSGQIEKGIALEMFLLR